MAGWVHNWAFGHARMACLLLPLGGVFKHCAAATVRRVGGDAQQLPPTQASLLDSTLPSPPATLPCAPQKDYAAKRYRALAKSMGALRLHFLETRRQETAAAAAAAMAAAEAEAERERREKRRREVQEQQGEKKRKKKHKAAKPQRLGVSD